MPVGRQCSPFALARLGSTCLPACCSRRAEKSPRGRSFPPTRALARAANFQLTAFVNNQAADNLERNRADQIGSVPDEWGELISFNGSRETPTARNSTDDKWSPGRTGSTRRAVKDHRAGDSG